MNTKKLLGIVFLAAGVVMIGFSYYTKNQVAQGQMQVDSAQSKVDAGNKLFSVNPVSKEVGKGLTGGVQRKIDEGQSDIDYYTNVAQWLMIGGVACLILGAGTLFLGGRKSSS